MDINEVTKEALTFEFNESNPNWMPNIEYNKAFLRSCLQHSWDKYQSQGHLFVNEVLDIFGLPRTNTGSVLGWHRDDRDTGFVEFAMLAGNKLLIRIYPGGLIWDRIEEN